MEGKGKKNEHEKKKVGGGGCNSLESCACFITEQRVFL
jgi:hypothetical protein